MNKLSHLSFTLPAHTTIPRRSNLDLFSNPVPVPPHQWSITRKNLAKHAAELLSRYKTAATFSNLNRFHCHNSQSLLQKNSYNSSLEHRRRDAQTPAYLKTLPPPPSPYAIAERGYVSPASLSRFHPLLLLLCLAAPDPGTRTGMNRSAPKAPVDCRGSTRLIEIWTNWSEDDLGHI
jgi:hypothetical protein